jgi:carbon storage regulator CsrA
MPYLMLTRRVGESVVIETPAGPVVVMLAEVDRRGDRVRLGFAADRSIAIWRSELKEMMEADRKNEAAVNQILEGEES